ncbi:zinc finger MYM-type protein 1-like [Bufo bufo]|uniref:zinc finger MYM-type protein 1-like n=1 Tax=Bufo bufo TaxID=8384 RepID=UPI001ABDD5F4|nr:zinc finger MYM-type protein 1-like [Bufo bufo]
MGGKERRCPRQESVSARGQSCGRIDSQIILQLEVETLYWRKVFKRCLIVIQHLAERGLLLRGKDEIIGSPHNGNYLGILEEMSKFDAFLEEHIKHYANKIKGHTSYLSSTVCEELIQILGSKGGSKVLCKIMDELKKVKFYSISVDSTFDIPHSDQLTFIVRYVLLTGSVERFLTFLPVFGHSGKKIAQLILDFLHKHRIDIKDYRGQSYDNAANMSGKYNGVQTIRERCCYASFISCAEHSLNLVGKNSPECNQVVYTFFNNLEQLYVFFSSSSPRWRQLVKKQKALGLPVVKHLSGTRWSARYNAGSALYKGYESICGLLECMSSDTDYSLCKNEACSLLDKFSELDSTILLVFWNTI